MKSSSVLIGLLLLAAGRSLSATEPTTPAPVVTAPAAAKKPADADYDALWAGFREKPAAPNLQQENPRAFFQWLAEHNARFATQALAFAEKYPQDRRRWDGIVQISYSRPLFITGFKDGFDAQPGPAGVSEDDAKLAEFKTAQAQRLRALIAAADAGEKPRTAAYNALMREALNELVREGSPANKAAYLAIVDEFTTAVPSAVARLASQHWAVLKQIGTPDELAAFEKKMEATGDPALKRMVAEEHGDYSRFNGIAALKFTAADGRAVDLSTLRGKVVLVDFWATWCPPCREEIPNVVANYTKYHAKGFEVIGVSLENARLAPTDDEAAKTRKLDAARRKMLGFTGAQGMAWPQYYDGLWWKNELALKYGIEAIPAMVLIDPAGRVVSIDARGERLETEIKRLLQL